MTLRACEAVHLAVGALADHPSVRALKPLARPTRRGSSSARTS